MSLKRGIGCSRMAQQDSLWVASVRQLWRTYAEVDNDGVVDGFVTDLVTVQLVHTDATRLHPGTPDHHA